MADATFDFVIVGSGAGGFAAAITAKLAGMRPLLLEKTPFLGGSTAMSGGVMWMPNSPVMTREGFKDSREDALRYMDNFVTKETLYSTPARREAFVDAVAPMIETMESQGMKYMPCYDYCDYYDLLPGGHSQSRSIVAELFDINRLGAWKRRLRAPHMRIPVHTWEVADLSLVNVAMSGKVMAARVARRMIWDKLTRQKRCGGGNALQGRMLEIALKLGIDIWTEAPLIDFDTRNGNVEGVHVKHDGRRMRIAAARGVLICAGGFAHNAAMRERYQRVPTSNEWTFSNPGDTGEAIEAMASVGAELALMDEAWWNSCCLGPDGKREHMVLDFAKPHGILVDQGGKRFVNEANSYMELGRAMYQRHTTTPAIPAFLIMDARFRKRYFFGVQPPGRMPRDWLELGFLKQDNTLAGLAAKCAMDPSGLETTVQRFNEFCQSGRDEDFGRGESVYNRYFADPTVKPNPSLGAVSEPPFLAAPIYPGDVGTCGGVVINERAQAMRPDGRVIEGLYAAGNCAASLCGPYYVGAGQSVASSGVFGFIAAKHAAT
jgi:3-oxosteroid 1-dehydrogenase